MTREQKVSFCKEMAERNGRLHGDFERIYRTGKLLYWAWPVFVLGNALCALASSLQGMPLLFLFSAAVTVWMLSRPPEYPENHSEGCLGDRQFWLDCADHIEQFGDTDVVD